MYNIIKFDYYDSFRCIGADCKNSCCKDWEVTMSKKDYLRLKAGKFPSEITDIMNAKLKRIKDGKGSLDDRYAKFIMNDEICPFLDNGWCLLQKKCGEEALVDICRLFPRHATSISNVVINSCTLACEAVVMKMMEYKDGLKLCCEESNDEQELLKSAFSTNFGYLKKDNQYAYLFDYFTLAFTILQKRELSFSSRMLMLGMAFQKLQQTCDAGQFDKIPSVVDRYIGATLDEKTKETLESFKLDLYNSKGLYYKTFIKLCNEKSSAVRSVFTRKAEHAERNIAENLEHTIQNAGILREYLSDKMIYIENIMINAFACMRFPFSLEASSLWDNYILFCCIFNMYIMSLIEMADDGMNDEIFVSLTTEFFKDFSHSQVVKHLLLDAYKENGFDTLPTLATLIQFF